MRMKPLLVLEVAVLAAAALQGQSANQPVYWSLNPPDCSALNESPIQIMNGSTTVGYSCFTTGTFLWLAAGGTWRSAIRVAAPASGAVGVAYIFFDQQGNKLTLDTTGAITVSSNALDFSLFANQPSEVDLRGLTSDAGAGYTTTATGSAYAVFLCPDAATCLEVTPQLLYSALPTYPWSLSVPITWDGAIWTDWSAVGMDDGGTNRLSLVIDNEDVQPAAFTVYVYDTTGTLVGTGSTPTITQGRVVENGVLGAGGTYGVLLSDVVPGLPKGLFKVLVDGGSIYSAVEMLQVSGTSATTLQVAPDSAPAASGSSATGVRRPDLRRLRMSSIPKPVFPALSKPADSR